MSCSRRRQQVRIRTSNTFEVFSFKICAYSFKQRLIHTSNFSKAQGINPHIQGMLWDSRTIEQCRNPCYLIRTSARSKITFLLLQSFDPY